MHLNIQIDTRDPQKQQRLNRKEVTALNPGDRPARHIGRDNVQRQNDQHSLDRKKNETGPAEISRHFLAFRRRFVLSEEDREERQHRREPCDCCDARALLQGLDTPCQIVDILIEPVHDHSDNEHRIFSYKCNLAVHVSPARQSLIIVSELAEQPHLPHSFKCRNRQYGHSRRYKTLHAEPLCRNQQNEQKHRCIDKNFHRQDDAGAGNKNRAVRKRHSRVPTRRHKIMPEDHCDIEQRAADEQRICREASREINGAACKTDDKEHISIARSLLVGSIGKTDIRKKIRKSAHVDLSKERHMQHTGNDQPDRCRDIADRQIIRRIAVLVERIHSPVH